MQANSVVLLPVGVVFLPGSPGGVYLMVVVGGGLDWTGMAWHGMAWEAWEACG